MLISALLETAIRAMKENRRVENSERAHLHHLEQRGVGAAELTGRDDGGGGERDQQIQHPRHHEAVKSARGKVCDGRFVSSATFTESSKPISA